ncbi:MAG: 3-dehydroquinate synthase [Fibrobacterota bacterium]
MKKIPVRLGKRSYNIHIESGLSRRLSALLAPFRGKGRMLILSDTNVRRRYPGLFRALASAGTDFLFIPPGESSKSLVMLERVLGFMLLRGHDRSSLLVALGGGVVGDLGGFAAAVFMRGIRYVQVPTTLLAQVDSSVGGKTAVNHRFGKNMVGAFHQPSGVFIDPGFLKTLPTREFINGYAECLKHGAIRSRPLFDRLCRDYRVLRTGASGLLDAMIADNCRIKARVVSADERESGLRAILNFGHTFGHALETLTRYRRYTHGEAVLLGMEAATVTARALKMLPENDARILLDAIARLGKVSKARLSADAVYRAMAGDKKNTAGALTLILPVRIGAVIKVVNPDKTAVMAGIRSIIKE